MFFLFCWFRRTNSNHITLQIVFFFFQVTSVLRRNANEVLPSQQDPNTAGITTYTPDDTSYGSATAAPSSFVQDIATFRPWYVLMHG